MGAVYKRKRHSCKLCKPHKMGFEPKHKAKYRAAEKRARETIRKAAGFSSTRMCRELITIGRVLN